MVGLAPGVTYKLNPLIVPSYSMTKLLKGHDKTIYKRPLIVFIMKPSYRKRHSNKNVTISTITVIKISRLCQMQVILKLFLYQSHFILFFKLINVKIKLLMLINNSIDHFYGKALHIVNYFCYTHQLWITHKFFC